MSGEFITFMRKHEMKVKLLTRGVKQLIQQECDTPTAYVKFHAAATTLTTAFTNAKKVVVNMLKGARPKKTTKTAGGRKANKTPIESELVWAIKRGYTIESKLVLVIKRGRPIESELV